LQVLSDPKKRSIYDQEGFEGLKRLQAGGGEESHFEDLFGSFFGFSRGPQSDETPRGENVVADLWVTLEEMYNGEFIELTRQKVDKKSSPGLRKCRCRREMRTTMLGPGQFQMHQVDVCDDCPNVKFEPVERTLEVEVERGMADGHLYPFPSEGEVHVDGDHGDLTFRIRQQKHKVFHRRGDDLYTNVTISLLESLIGYRIALTHLDGHKVILESDKVTAPFSIIHKPGEGMPNHDHPNKFGSLYVTIHVEYPQDRQLTDTERMSLSQLFPSADIKSAEEPTPARAFNGLDRFNQRSK
ncbi:Molecular chaperone, partial [Fasciolopsis buskii]